MLKIRIEVGENNGRTFYPWGEEFLIWMLHSAGVEPEDICEEECQNGKYYEITLNERGVLKIAEFLDSVSPLRSEIDDRTL